jgi:predicted membrane channel-forming protein YqfA (hemolysin III family)
MTPDTDRPAPPAAAQARLHLVFSLVMGAMMVFVMTFVITSANIGWPRDFLLHWARAFAIAYVVAVPVIYFLAPLARRISARLLGISPPG